MKSRADAVGLSSWPARFFAIALVVFTPAAASLQAAPTNLVANGSFELSTVRAGVPDAWACAGNAAVRQALTLDQGPDGSRCAKLACSAFEGDGPDFHVMLCQVGCVAVRKDHWYRLSFKARTEAVKVGSIEIALVNTREWNNAGLAEAFPAGNRWENFEFVFRAKADLPAAQSRLQFWFRGTGTLWIDDVVLEEHDRQPQWFPQISSDGVKNLLPDSSFECGAASWGSYTWGLSGWAGNLYRLEGELDSGNARHGAHSLRISLPSTNQPVFWFDYYDPVRQPVRRVLAANRGWFRVDPGQSLTLSAWMRANFEGVTGELAAVEPEGRLQHRSFKTGTNWQRHVFTFTPTGSFCFIAAGLNLAERESATLWIDAVQLERGNSATAYAPRQPVESSLQTSEQPPLFTHPRQGATLKVTAFNDTDHEQSLRGNIGLTDFFDQPAGSYPVNLRVPPGRSATAVVPRICRDRLGFFRAAWSTGVTTQYLRFSILEPITTGATNAPFGFNHAYPWDFLVRAAGQAGVAWWRDWSAKWDTIEPEPGKLDFSVPDAQIRRVQQLQGQVQVLLPFPSANWSSSANTGQVAKAAGNNSYLRQRLPVAYAPRNLEDFSRYAASVVRHYQAPAPGRVTTYQVLNEPVYTDYALPRQFGYGLPDYLRLLAGGYAAMKQVDPACEVVGGISAGIEAGLTREFITSGGLRSVDVFDLHIYDPPRPAESYEAPFLALENLARTNGGPKPVWITEWGCYADDDPPCVPMSFGDDTMNRCRWRSEREATEHIVKFAAVAMSHGLRRIFFHAGTCGTINQPDAGGVLFEYGGAPRKMLPGVAAFTRLVGVPLECVQQLEGRLWAKVFRTGAGLRAVAWCPDGEVTLRASRRLRIYDIMGNELQGRVVVGSTPIYCAAPSGSVLTFDSEN